MFFLSRLVSYDGNRFNPSQAIFALVGYLEIAERLDDPNDPLFTSPAFARNAHVLRWLADPSSFKNFAIFKGSVNSRRFRYAVPFSRTFIEEIPILKADGSRWDWGELPILGSLAPIPEPYGCTLIPIPKRAKRTLSNFGKKFGRLKWGMILRFSVKFYLVPDIAGLDIFEPRFKEETSIIRDS